MDLQCHSYGSNRKPLLHLLQQMYLKTMMDVEKYRVIIHVEMENNKQTRTTKNT